MANNLIKSVRTKVKKYPLELNFCDKCFNVQLSVAIDPKIMFSNYLYLSSTSNEFQTHFEKATEKYIRDLKIKKTVL